MKCFVMVLNPPMTCAGSRGSTLRLGDRPAHRRGAFSQIHASKSFAHVAETETGPGGEMRHVLSFLLYQILDGNIA